MKKIAHVLKDSTGKSFPTHIIFFDTETREVAEPDGRTELRLNFGVACYYRASGSGREAKETWITFTDKATLFRFIIDRAYAGQRLTLVAHNISFDAKVVDLFSQLKESSFKLQKIITTGTRNIWKFSRDRATIICLDNMNFFNSSLADLGASIGIAKLKMPAADAPFSEWETYCRRDVEVMVKAWALWRSFLKDNDLGNFGLTLASQSLNAFRHRFMRHKIYVHNNTAAIQLEREAYHGGRTEAFQIGTLPRGNYHYLDVNSMYPSVMRDFKLPTRLRELTGRISLDLLGRYLKHSCVIAKVRVRTRENVYAVVQNSRLVFPVGTFTTTLTSRELSHALGKGHILAVESACIYESDFIFREYVDFFYTERLRYKKDGNPEYAQCCKLLLNCLYGKFGQKQDVWEKIGEYPDAENKVWEEIDAVTFERSSFRLLNGLLEKRVGFEEGFNAFVAVAAHVTADARMKLWDYMSEVGLDNVYYCDTDSIFTNDVGLERAAKFRRDGELGYLSLKRSDTSLAIYGAKDYQFGASTVIKGIRAGAESLGNATFRQTRFEGFLGAWRNGRLNKQVIAPVDKRLKRIYHKGNVSITGRVEPFDITA